MAQVTLYLPDNLVERLKGEAEAAHKSLSAYVRDRLDRGRPSTDDLDRLFGTCDLGDPPPDPPPEEVGSL
jgi:hypothetical protein